MCEYNRPYLVPYGQHPDDRLGPRSTEIVVRPASAWQRRLAQLPMNEVQVINQAEQDAAAIAADVHLYRSPTSPFLGVSLEPGTGPNVKIWEH